MRRKERIPNFYGKGDSVCSLSLILAPSIMNDNGSYNLAELSSQAYILFKRLKAIGAEFGEEPRKKWQLTAKPKDKSSSLLVLHC
jgi:hypothetical protein